MVRVSSPAKLRPWSELTAKMVMGMVPRLVTLAQFAQNFGVGLPECACANFAQFLAKF